jgi:BASS family bile acid:Na+ symporter
MNTVVQVLSQLSILVFVVASMLSMGLSLSVPEIIAPLRNLRLAIVALIANFIVMPLVAYGLSWLFGLDQPLKIALILLGLSAGAPFLPRLTQHSKDNVAFAVGLMVLLMVVTVFYLPLVLPIALGPDTSVDPLKIAVPLIVLILGPLVVGLLTKARYEDTATTLRPMFSQASNIALITLGILLLIQESESSISLLGTGAILADVLFIVIAFAVGFLLGGPDRQIRTVLGMGTAFRNITATFVVATTSFEDPNVLIALIEVAFITLIILFPLGGEIARSSKAA